MGLGEQKVNRKHSVLTDLSPCDTLTESDFLLKKQQHIPGIKQSFHEIASRNVKKHHAARGDISEKQRLFSLLSVMAQLLVSQSGA